MNLKSWPQLDSIQGIRLGVASAGIKKPGRKDIVIMELASESTVAAIFTQNAFCAAPVTLAKSHLTQTSPRYLLINTGNANAGTGGQGLKDAESCCQTLAALTQTAAETILPFSTGVIGEPLPVNKITAALPAALAALDNAQWQSAAEAIMTTDTRPKGFSVSYEHAGQTVTVTGIAKGAGMICPNMATLLAFVATDACIELALLQQCLLEAAEQSFNRITVDGDTSTNDACLLMATQKMGEIIKRTTDPAYAAFQAAVKTIFKQLAWAIVRDGEGATKFVTVQVEQGNTAAESLQVAYTVAHSPLVKTALFASDPNWGRILAAVGRAGLAELTIQKINIYLNEVCIVEKGGRALAYTEALGQQALAPADIVIRIQLGRGQFTETVWTTDLSYDYVKINAEYRT